MHEGMDAAPGGFADFLIFTGALALFPFAEICHGIQNLHLPYARKRRAVS